MSSRRSQSRCRLPTHTRPHDPYRVYRPSYDGCWPWPLSSRQHKRRSLHLVSTWPPSSAAIFNLRPSHQSLMRRVDMNDGGLGCSWGTGTNKFWPTGGPRPSELLSLSLVLPAGPHRPALGVWGLLRYCRDAHDKCTRPCLHPHLLLMLPAHDSDMRGAPLVSPAPQVVLLISRVLSTAYMSTLSRSSTAWVRTLLLTDVKPSVEQLQIRHRDG